MQKYIFLHQLVPETEKKVTFNTIGRICKRTWALY